MIRNLGGYTLLRELGRGASSVVFAAEDEGGYPHALKLLHPMLAEDEAARERIRREAEAINSIQGEGIARVHDFEIDGVEPFIVTDLVEGSTLAELVAKRGPMSVPQVARFGRKIAMILDNVHAAGVTHRDVKPGNIILSPNGPVLVDFGIAQSEGAERLTSTGLVTGTAGYIPPYVLQGGQPGAYADWWAWVGTLLFAATGHPPFGEGNQAGILTRVMAGEVDTSGLSSAVAAVFKQALSVSDAQFPVWQDFLADLESASAASDLANADLGSDLGSDLDSADADLVGSDCLDAEGVAQLLQTPVEQRTERLPIQPTEELSAQLPQDSTEQLPQDRTWELPQDSTQQLPQDATWELPQDRTQQLPQYPMQQFPPGLPAMVAATPSPQPQPLNFDPLPILALDQVSVPNPPRPMNLFWPRAALGIFWVLFFYGFPFEALAVFFGYGVLGNFLGYVWQRYTAQPKRMGIAGAFGIVYAVLYGAVRAVVFTLIAALLSAGVSLGVFALLGYGNYDLPRAFEVPALVLDISQWHSISADLRLLISGFVYLMYAVYWCSPSVASHRRLASFQVGKYLPRKRLRLTLNLCSLLIVLSVIVVLYTAYTGYKPW